MHSQWLLISWSSTRGIIVNNLVAISLLINFWYRLWYLLFFLLNPRGHHHSGLFVWASVFVNGQRNNLKLNTCRGICNDEQKTCMSSRPMITVEKCLSFEGKQIISLFEWVRQKARSYTRSGTWHFSFLCWKRCERWFEHHRQQIEASSRIRRNLIFNISLRLPYKCLVQSRHLASAANFAEQFWVSRVRTTFGWPWEDLINFETKWNVDLIRRWHRRKITNIKL